jgi:hypothetical protein
VPVISSAFLTTKLFLQRHQPTDAGAITVDGQPLPRIGLCRYRCNQEHNVIFPCAAVVLNRLVATAVKVYGRLRRAE